MDLSEQFEIIDVMACYVKHIRSCNSMLIRVDTKEIGFRRFQNKSYLNCKN